jgi:PAS domain S-box-containing protein
MPSPALTDRIFRLIVDAMDKGVATISPAGVILSVNPCLCSMTGQTAVELVGSAVLDLIPDACRPTFARMLDMDVGDGARGEIDLSGPDGVTVPVLLAIGGFDLDGMFLRSLVLTDLTAQRAADAPAAKAHEAPLQQHAFLERAQQILGLGWWTYDPAREEMLIFSPAACEIFGLIPAEFDGKLESLSSLVHPDDLPRINEAYAAALEGGTPYQAEHRIVRPDGSLRWVLMAAVVQGDHADGSKRMLGICQDITDRKRIQDEVRAAAMYNRSLIEASLNPMVTIGPDGMITDVNIATEQMTGYARAELLGTGFSDYFTEPDQARAGYEQAFRDGNARDYPLELRHRAGHITSVLYNAAVYRDPSGQVLGVMAAARDVTQVKRAEAALRESEMQLRDLFDNAQVGMGVVALNGDLLRINSCFCQTTGYSADELLSLGLLAITHPGDRAADLANKQRLLSGEIDTYSMEKRYLHKGGGVIFAEVGLSLVSDPDGKPRLAVGTMRDLTAQRLAEAEVRELNAELEARVEQRTAELTRANQDLEVFSYTISHDLRAPLRALDGFSEALLEEYSDRLDETGREYAGRIAAASQRMATLIDDLLHLSRVSRADMSLGLVNLSASAISILDELQLQRRDPDRRVRFSIQDDVWATADRALIRSVLQNLIENAWKFTARRSEALIEFGATPADDAMICCYVRDNGAGFDPAYADKLFQPFERLHSATEFPGTGIGLASVQRIIERHGGRTWAEGAIDNGATFYFTLTKGRRVSE